MTVMPSSIHTARNAKKWCGSRALGIMGKTTRGSGTSRNSADFTLTAAEKRRYWLAQTYARKRLTVLPFNRTGLPATSARLTL